MHSEVSFGSLRRAIVVWSAILKTTSFSVERRRFQVIIGFVPTETTKSVTRLVKSTRLLILVLPPNVSFGLCVVWSFGGCHHVQCVVF